MIPTRYLIYFILFNFIVATPQINLHYTNWIRESSSNHDIQHDCLRIVTSIAESNMNRQIISYCSSELQSKFNIKLKADFPKFTFAELVQKNITSQQLYLWSAPIDIIEDYQYYLNQLSTSNDISMKTQLFFNCTLPRFGSVCQYELIYYHENYSSLQDIIQSYYHTVEYNPTDLTCFIHLKCNRGPTPACLDWSEICDGQVDCLDGNFDEEHCWQLEINECQDDEYQCSNGQCIPKSFYRDNINIPDCLDRSDEAETYIKPSIKCSLTQPSFACEDITCQLTFLTNSCVEKRKTLLLEALYSDKDNSTTEECWSAFKCIIHVPDSGKQKNSSICERQTSIKIINDTCPDMFFIPNVPMLLGHIYFAHFKTDSITLSRGIIRLPHLCYNGSHYDQYFLNYPKLFFNNLTCYRPNIIATPMILAFSWDMKYQQPLFLIYQALKGHSQLISYTTEICNRSNMYQCMDSPKCVSINRLIDGKYDCPLRDDEDIILFNDSFVTKSLKSHFKCDLADKYIHQSLITNKKCDCKVDPYGWCEDEDILISYARQTVSFQTICDGFTELLPISIEGENYTDETECQQWSCNNVYTRCDGLWNCLNGEDELNCNVWSILNCSLDHHLCVSPDTNQLICLSKEKANDGNIDCLGGTDEPTLCRENYTVEHNKNFYCRNTTFSCIKFESLCNNRKQCAYKDDEQFCVTNRTKHGVSYICSKVYASLRSNVENFLCHETRLKIKPLIKYFSLNETNELVQSPTTTIDNLIQSNSSITKMSYKHESTCHRGVDLRVWLDNDKNLTMNTCLCPPSYYGNQCQYQNQRVSLTIKFRALSDSWLTVFAIVISLVDNSGERIIHSYEQFTYLSVRDCKVKFHIYLLYSTRPKLSKYNYSIHIDIYEKVSLKYRASLLFPIPFLFLPVHRLAYIVVIPQSYENIPSCSNLQCIHGRCIKYANTLQTTSFCQCYQGWSGQYCHISHTCTCASDSLCIGVSAGNRSICVCPVHKFGPRCFLTDTTCQTNANLACQNGGQCIPTDEYIGSKQKFVCICPKGYSGDRCQILDNSIILSFGNDIAVSQSIFVHFIEVIYNNTPIRATTLRTIHLTQESLTIYWSRPFHLVFIELLNKNYYLAIFQKNYRQSATITKKINGLDRCQHIKELFNETVIKLHMLRRIKYYHLPCQTSLSNLSCFYDDIHLCLCYDFGQTRLANCFEFNHNMAFDCLGQSVCENGGQCFQDTSDCPQRSMCICPPCFYGTRCQFQTSRFGLSVDAILGYHILPHTRINNQPKLVQVSLVLTIIFMIAGFINGIFALITFNNEAICQVGCGLYLYGSSITTLLTTILFGLKFWILLFAQMTSMSNRLFLKIQCISLDFLLRLCVNMDQWLNACVAVERAINVRKGTSFNREKSKQVAKIVIIILFIFIVGTSIYDPYYRRIIDEDNEDSKRIWCVVAYSSKLQIFSSIVHTLHFFAPFMINLTSAVILITKRSHQQTYLQAHQTYNKLLQEQIRQHKHLFVAPVVLVILALPRLIISFVSKCMKSTNDAWLYLMGYFISFIPPMLTFIVFVLPSKFYKKQFRNSIIAYRTRIQRMIRTVR